MRKFGAGQSRAKVRQRVDRSLLILADAIWIELEERGITAPTKERRRR